jgi:hypothetical protein
VAEALVVLQVGLWLVIALLGGGRIVAVHRGAISGAAIARTVHRAARATVAEILAAAAPSPLSALGSAIEHDDPEDAAIALREGMLRAERAVRRGIAPLRILGVLASAVGFAAVAYQISWITADHGLLDLDPARVGRIASERAALALALALAGSGTAMGLGAVLRSRARADLHDLGLLHQAIERALPRWTGGRAE